MASRIQGITVEIGGNTTKLQNALKDVNGQIKSTQSQLKDVNKLLKLDPGNTELLAPSDNLVNTSENAYGTLDIADIPDPKYSISTTPKLFITTASTNANSPYTECFCFILSDLTINLLKFIMKFSRFVSL